MHGIEGHRSRSSTAQDAVCFPTSTTVSEDLEVGAGVLGEAVAHQTDQCSRDMPLPHNFDQKPKKTGVGNAASEERAGVTSSQRLSYFLGC